MKVVDLNSSTDDKIFALVYGASGTGKTHLMGTVGEIAENILLIDIDQGYKTIKFAKDLQTYRKKFTIVDFKAFEDLDKAYKLVNENNPEKWSKLLGKQIEKPFDWIIWDTWSEIQWYMQQGLRADQGLLSGNGGSKLEYRKNFQIQHWGMITDLNKMAIESLRECNVNQIFTMQERMDKDEISGQTYGGPAIHGKMVQEVPAYFDVVVRTYVDISGAFVATTKPKGKWCGKTRLGEGAEYKNPTIKQVFGV